MQFIQHQALVRLAAEANAVISLEHRPGHFIVRGRRFATVWPPEAAPLVRQALGRAHITGPHRTLSQDVSFGIDQLVEIGLRALSAAVNDTFTAMTCIDWLGENLCKIVTGSHPARVYRDSRGSTGSSRPSPLTSAWCSAPSRRSGSPPWASRP